MLDEFLIPTLDILRSIELWNLWNLTLEYFGIC